MNMSVNDSGKVGRSGFFVLFASRLNGKWKLGW